MTLDREVAYFSDSVSCVLHTRSSVVECRLKREVKRGSAIGEKRKHDRPAEPGQGRGKGSGEPGN